MTTARAGQVVAALAILLVADRLLARIIPPAPQAMAPPPCGPVYSASNADVVILGDSQSEDADRGRGRSWVSHLREIRRAPANDSIVSNACGGMRAGEAARRWPDGSPRILIFWAGWNDLVAGRDGPSPRTTPGGVRASKASGFVRLAAALTRDVRRARREASLDAISAGPAFASVDIAGRVGPYADAVREVHRRAVAEEMALMLVSPPWAGTALEPSEYRSLALQTGHSVATIARMHAALVASYHQLCRDLVPVTCYDAAAEVDALPPATRRRLFADPLHWSAEGSEWVATRIDEVLGVMPGR